MRVMLSLLTLGLCISCGERQKKAGDDQAGGMVARETSEAKPSEPRIDAQVAAAPDAAPDPTTPEGLEQARKQSMIDGRHADTVRFCDLLGLAPGKSDPQALLGCTLSACRLKDVGKAKAWSKGLPKPLFELAVKNCAADGSPI